MDFEHSFTIPVPPDQAWDVLLDVERVAPCMPGAAVDSVEGDHITGHVKVKVGPITMTYAGRARFVERDQDARTATIEASGKESRGTGTASATVHAVLRGDNGQTRVTMTTTLHVTGRPAQMGRGVLADVSGKLVERFAANLAEQLTMEKVPGRQGTVPAGSPPGIGQGQPGGQDSRPGAQGEPGTAEAGAAGAAGAARAPAGPAAAAAGTSEPAAGTRKEGEPLNLLGVAAGPVMKRLIPAIGALIAALFVAIMARLRRKRRHAS